jgi:CRISPR-associated protein Cas1
MATLYVTQDGAQVHKENERLIIRKGKETLEDVPLIKLDRVVMVGRGVSLTTPAMYALTQKAIDVVFLRRGGGFAFRLADGGHKHSRLRFQQALQTNRPEFALAVAKTIVAGKVRNQRTLMMRHARDAGQLKRLQPALDMMAQMGAQAAQTTTLDELRGTEGKAAAEYFGLYRQLLNDTMGFQQRAYYPPPDPLNALLSFGYTLLLSEVESAALMTGLDPALGMLHAIDYGRPSMALDLEEEFRAVIVDSVVLQAVNSGLIKRDDFELDGARKGWRLKDEPRAKFLTLYEARMQTEVEYPFPQPQRTAWRRVLLLQAQLMARVVLGEVKAYVPVEIR